MEADYLDMVEKRQLVLDELVWQWGDYSGGGTDSEVNALWEFGIAMGISFQIRDDVLDLITARELLGKDKASDLTEGKMTLVMIQDSSTASGLTHRSSQAKKQSTAQLKI